MKRPQPDIGEILKGSFINDLSTSRKLKKYWGTTYVQGVKVFVEREYYHPISDRSANFEKLYKFLGAYEDVTTADMEGVAKAWLYFNKNKATELPTISPLDDDYELFVTNNLNQLWWDNADGPMPEGLTLTTTVVIEAERPQTKAIKKPVSSTILDPSLSDEELIAVIRDNYETLWDTCLISQQGVGVINKGSITDPVSKVTTPDEDDLTPDDPWLQTLARYALRTAGVPCIIKNVELGIGGMEVTSTLYTTYIITIEIPYFEFITSSGIVANIVADLTGNYYQAFNYRRNRISFPNGYYTAQAIKKMDSEDLQDDPDLVSRPYTFWEDVAVHSNITLDDLWVLDNKKWYLKVAPFDDPKSFGLKRKELNSYVLQLIEADYKKKKVSWWKKAIAVITFVIAIVFAPVTGGWSLNAATFAAAVLFASLVLTLVILATSALGYESWATAFAWASKTVEPLVQVATVILIVTGISGAIEKAKQSVAEQAGKKAAEVTLQEALTEMLTTSAESFIASFTKTMETGMKDLIAGNLTTNAALSFSQTMVKLVNLGYSLKLESIANRNKDLQAEYDKLMEESARESDILMGFARVYAKPATADWSIYAEQFDLPYERGGGPLALGNIQKTTKQALRKGDYSDPIFDSILVV